jgi:hypothetical protein
MSDGRLVHVRTPTYRRPEALRRCLHSLIAQTWPHWVCDVFDDDPEASARAVCASLDDPRIRYNHNRPQRFASTNIDQCFSRANPHEAGYFCVVEDDNYILPRFMEANIGAMADNGVEIVLRNQLVELNSGTEHASLASAAIFDAMFRETVYAPEEFRLSLIAGIGVSNGALFWSSRAVSALEIGFSCTATLQEYMRTYSIVDDIHVAMEPLGVWAANGEQTTRDLGNAAGYYKREFDLKRAIQVLQRAAWREASPEQRRVFRTTDRLAFDPRLRAGGLAKALISPATGGTLTVRETARLIARGMLIRCCGRLTDDFERFLDDRIERLSRARAERGGSSGADMVREAPA